MEVPIFKVGDKVATKWGMFATVTAIEETTPGGGVCYKLEWENPDRAILYPWRAISWGNHNLMTQDAYTTLALAR